MDILEDSSKVFEKYEHSWSIDSLSRICSTYQEGSAVQSPIFPNEELKYKWRLEFFPTSVLNNECTTLYLRLSSDACSTFSVKYYLQLRKSNDEIIHEVEIKAVFDDKKRWSKAYMENRQKVLSLISDDILKIRIVIFAEVLTLQPHHMIDIRENISVKLRRDFESMLKNHEFCDFVFKLEGDDEIPVHRCVLTARSPVFSAMFNHDTTEKELGYVEITDIDKHTMLHLLDFIYSGTIKKLTEDEAITLLIAADKYAVIDLKDHCAKILTEFIKVSNALDILLLGELYSVLELKNAAYNYILENFEKFSDPKLFDKVQNDPHLLVELITKASVLFLYK